MRESDWFISFNSQEKKTIHRIYPRFILSLNKEIQQKKKKIRKKDDHTVSNPAIPSHHQMPN